MTPSEKEDVFQFYANVKCLSSSKTIAGVSSLPEFERVEKWAKTAQV